MKIIIPARKNSKGLPFKNRKLFKHTADIIPDVIKHLTYVVTDDIEIKKMAEGYKFNVLDRPPEVSSDESSTKDLMIYTIESLGIQDETILMLYLTYPLRKWKDVNRAMTIFDTSNSDSLLCKSQLDTSPFLILKEEKDNRGSQLFYHNMYRRQDYPSCFELSHYICLFKSSEINNLNNNLYNHSTYFLPIDKTIDVDEKKDLDRFEGK
jgi:CMP-N-acetylneuraminic acid synthetase